MDTTRAHARHEPPARPRVDRGAIDPPPAPGFGGTDDWVARAVGPDRDVLLVGPDAARHAGVLARQRCRVAAVGCGEAQASGLGGSAIAGDLDALDLDAAIGDRRFDAIVATELPDLPVAPGPLLDRCRGWLRPGGVVVASQTGPAGAGRWGAGSPRTLLALVEGAGYAVTHHRPEALPAPGPAPPAWVDRSLVAAVPNGAPAGEWDRPAHRALIEGRDAAERHAADLAVELRGARAEARARAGDLARSRRREAELADLLRRAHERAERGDDELRALAGRFADERHALVTRYQAEIDIQVEARRAVEERLGRLRRSLPGRILLAARALAGRGGR